MDWTGGTRHRYAGKSKGNATVQKQKAYFAKARAANGYQVIPDTFLQHTASEREHRPLLNGIEPSQHPNSRETSHARDSSLNSHRKTRLPDTDRISRKDRCPEHVAQTHQQPNKAVTEEEAALIANRERLLARNDWLGLAATRPIRIKFPSDRERQRIGKRRKIDKPRARVDRPAGADVFAHPVEARPVPFEPMLSGAIENDDIQIKVGTDAFLSQTHRSRPSHNSINTSIRPMSTDFGPISEESMLLKADSDGFEAQEGSLNDRFEAFVAREPRIDEQDRHGFAVQYNDRYLPDALQRHGWHHRAKSSSVSEVERHPCPPVAIEETGTPLPVDHYQQAVPSNAQYPWDPFATERQDFNAMSEYDDGTTNLSMHALASLHHEAGRSQESEDIFEPLTAKPEQRGRHPGEARPVERRESQYREVSPTASNYKTSKALQPTQPEYNTGRPSSGNADSEDDERVWKGFMHVREAVSSGVSMAALRSSSMHQTQSTASAWPTTTFAEAEVSDEMLDDQEDLGDQYLQVEPGNQPADREQSNPVPTVISSPSPSHRQILQLVNQAPAAEAGEEVNDQDELWRQFVVGSQSSQSQSSPGGRRRAWTNHSDELLPARLASIEPVEEPPRSDRMTTGGSTHVVASTDDSQDDLSSQNGPNTSLIAHATTFNPGSDDVEQSESLPHPRRKNSNVHANAVLVGTLPKRHYETRRRISYAPLPRVVPHVLMKGSTLANPKSIYDLSTSGNNR